MITPETRLPYQVQFTIDLGDRLTLTEAIHRARQLGALINNQSFANVMWSTEDMYLITPEGFTEEVHDQFTADTIVSAINAQPTTENK